MKLTKAEILVIINDIDTILVGINQCKADIEADITEVTKEVNQLIDELNQLDEDFNQLHSIQRLTEESILEADTYRKQMVAEFEAISKAEAEAEAEAVMLAQITAEKAEQAKRAKYDVKLGDSFDDYIIAVVNTISCNADTGAHMVCAFDIKGAYPSRWNDPIEVTSIVFKNAPGRLLFSSEELRDLNVVPASSVHKSI